MKRAYHWIKLSVDQSFLQDENVQLMRSWKIGFHPCQFEGSLLLVTCKIGTLEFLPYTELSPIKICVTRQLVC